MSSTGWRFGRCGWGSRRCWRRSARANGTHASLCEGWRVRDVAGHLALVPTITTWQMLSAAPRARFNPNRINTLLAVRAGSVATSEIVQKLRDHAEDRTTAKALDTRNALFDAIVHSQDMAIPLGRTFAVPVDFTRQGLDRVWNMGGPSTPNAASPGGA